MRVVVLRLGHRQERDKRITTHVGLVARAFGAHELIIAGHDESVLHSLADVVDRWGGDFKVRQDASWREEIRSFKESGGKLVHLTMYGSNLPDVIDEIRLSESIMVAVGSEKVPPEMYDLADWNCAVGNQPHSEVAALAVFLDRLFKGDELSKDFPGKIQILPAKRGKRVVENLAENLSARDT